MILDMALKELGTLEGFQQKNDVTSFIVER